MNTSQPASTFLETLKQYGLALWRRAWLILALTMLGAGFGYVYSKIQTPMYASAMRVMVVRPLKEQTSDLTFWMMNPQVAQNYAQLGQTPGFNQKVITRAGRIGLVTAFAMPESQFIFLNAQVPDPASAEPLLNAAFDVLTEEIRALQQERYRQVEDSLTAQTEEISRKIAESREQLDERYSLLVAEEKLALETQIFELEEQLEAAVNKQQASQLQTRLIAARQAYATLLQTNRIPASRDLDVTRLERNLALYQNLYTNLLSSRENVRLLALQGTPPLLRVEDPVAPLVPYTPRTRRNTALAGLAGFGLAVGLIFLLEFLSDTLKPGEALRQRLPVPILAQLPLVQSGEELPVESDPRSLPAEAYRILRTNLAFSAIDRRVQIVLVTSPGPRDGKSTVAANLAAVLSQSGRKVLLVDANLRRPALHKLLDLQNRFGLSDVIRGENGAFEQLVQVYQGRNGVRFEVLTSGSLPPNPLEMLDSARMAMLIMGWVGMYDFLILDAPALGLSEAQVLASQADGVLLVGRAGRTRVGAIRHALDVLAEIRARVLGLALNAIPGQQTDRGSHSY